MRQLQVLTAARNSLCSLEASALSSPALAHLDASGNCLTCIAGLRNCHRLLVLDVSRNVLSSLQPLHACSLLQVLRPPISLRPCC